MKFSRIRVFIVMGRMIEIIVMGRLIEISEISIIVWGHQYVSRLIGQRIDNFQRVQFVTQNCGGQGLHTQEFEIYAANFQSFSLASPYLFIYMVSHA